MKCPFCAHGENKVIDSRISKDGDAIRRRRECLGCGKRFTTYEFVEEVLPMVVKKDGRREPFDRTKIRTGIKKACEKRPISTDAIETVVDNVERACQEFQDKEIPSSAIGEEDHAGTPDPRRRRLCPVRIGLPAVPGCQRLCRGIEGPSPCQEGRGGRKAGGIAGVHGNHGRHGVRPAPDAPGRGRPAGGRHLPGSGRRPDRRQHRRQRRLSDRHRPERRGIHGGCVGGDPLPDDAQDRQGGRPGQPGKGPARRGSASEDTSSWAMWTAWEGFVEKTVRSQSVIFGFEIDPGLGRYIVAKGSITVDGISLTVNRCEKNRVLC